MEALRNYSESSYQLDQNSNRKEACQCNTGVVNAVAGVALAILSVLVVASVGACLLFELSWLVLVVPIVPALLIIGFMVGSVSSTCLYQREVNRLWYKIEGLDQATNAFERALGILEDTITEY